MLMFFQLTGFQDSEPASVWLLTCGPGVVAANSFTAVFSEFVALQHGQHWATRQAASWRNKAAAQRDRVPFAPQGLQLGA